MSRPSDAELDNPAFYDRHWERTETATQPAVIEKARVVLSMIPDDVRTIVDVGCGDGYLTHRLAERFAVLAIDRSPVALTRVQCRSLLASADALPLPDQSVDLVFCSEVLEHLPDETLRRAASELYRVSSRYVFITVPHRENLRRRIARCRTCDLAFHVDGHLHSFDAAALDRLFPEMKRIATWLGGPAEASTYGALEVLRRRVAGRDWVWNGSKLRCPRCGEERFSPLKRGFLRRSADRAIDRATSALNTWTGRGDIPYWLLAVYERGEAT